MGLFDKIENITYVNGFK